MCPAMSLCRAISGWFRAWRLQSRALPLAALGCASLMASAQPVLAADLALQTRRVTQHRTPWQRLYRAATELGLQRRDITAAIRRLAPEMRRALSALLEGGPIALHGYRRRNSEAPGSPSVLVVAGDRGTVTEVVNWNTDTGVASSRKSSLPAAVFGALGAPFGLDIARDQLEAVPGTRRRSQRPSVIDVFPRKSSADPRSRPIASAPSSAHPTDNPRLRAGPIEEPLTPTSSLLEPGVVPPSIRAGYRLGFDAGRLVVRTRPNTRA